MPSGNRQRWFAPAAVVLGCGAAIAVLLALDVYAHARLARSALNIWGYRGPIAGRKGPHEQRLVVIGGSTVFGLGLPWDQSVPAQLEQQLRARAVNASVVNLGVDGENAFAFVDTLNDYAYLKYDAVIFYEGYNNLLWTEPEALRHRSWVFRTFGYWPILPTAIDEKYLLWRYHGDLAAAYALKKTVFRPNRDDVAPAIKRQIGPLTGSVRPRDIASCGPPWLVYCEAMGNAVAAARARHARTLVVTQPYISDSHVDQQNALQAMLRARFRGDPGVRYLNLGAAIDLHDQTVAYDGMHLTERGNATVAARLTAPAAALLDSSGSPR